MQSSWYIYFSEKICFAKQEVKYVGFVVNCEGLKVDPDKVKAIRKFPQPTNLPKLRSFMGLAKQLGGYSKVLIERTLPLRPLLKSKQTFQ